MSTQRERAYLARPESVRQANERIADFARRYKFVSRVPMLCECDDDGCRVILQVGLDEYDELRRRPEAFLTAPGH
jgi:hypothetical protein